MIKVGLVTTPLSSGHTARGVGFYTKNLLSELKSLAPGDNFEIEEIKSSTITGNFDLIHYPFFDLFFPSLPLVKNTRTVVTIHDVIPLEFPHHFPPGIKGGINLIRQKLALLNVDRVITDSYASVKGIRRYLQVPHAKIKLVYLAPASHYRPITDTGMLSGVKKKYHLPDKFVLYVGDINWNKNLPGLAQVCHKLNVSLVIAGKQALEIDALDTVHPELTHLVSLKPYFQNAKLPVIRLGFISDEELTAVYNLAAVYCQPSFAEGFGLPVLEALACGTPVACSDTHSLPEIAGEAAVYFDPDKIDSIVKALKSVLTDSRLRSDLIAKGLIQAKKFSWEKTARDTLDVYREIFNSS